jgi:molybdate transport system ATP-binding protein
MDGDTDATHSTLTWEVRLRKLLRQGGSQFELDVDFRTAAQRVVIFGPSGAGKTQTLRMIAGLGTPDEARVVVGGQVLCDTAQGRVATPQERRLAYVFQEYALFPHLTVTQNVAFALRRGWANPSKAVRDERVERWISSFHLESVAGHYPHQISGGQRQRTALARALVTNPQALLLDEPFAALDKGLREHLRNELKALQIELQLPMLLITHDDDDVNSLAQEVIRIDGGKVVDKERAW